MPRKMTFLRLAKLTLEKTQKPLTVQEIWQKANGFGFTKELPQKDFNRGHVRTIDMWGFCESQETVSVSPQMFDEFIFPYQLPIMERFGLNCYGCCEPLSGKLDLLRSIPNLRRVSISPWADIGVAAEHLQDGYILSWKPHPAWVANPGSYDADGIRSYVRSALEAAGSCVLEIVLKDTITVARRPERLDIWSRIVRDEIDRIWGPYAVGHRGGDQG